MTWAMQCPRCYFSNPAGTRVCEYCGARLEGTTDTQSRPASASAKRKTMLGPLPTKPESAGAPPPARPQTRIDPDDPFRIAAQGVGATQVGHIAPPAPEPPPPPPPEPPRPRSVARPTIVTAPPVDQPAVVGSALVLLAGGEVRAVVLREGRTRLGRRPDAEIVVDDPEASTDHALLRIDGDRAWLLDTSANGTVVSGVPCINDRADVSSGSVLVIGSTAIVIQLLDPEARAHLVGLG